jgi:hypothetical protein
MGTDLYKFSFALFLKHGLAMEKGVDCLPMAKPQAIIHLKICHERCKAF